MQTLKSYFLSFKIFLAVNLLVLHKGKAVTLALGFKIPSWVVKIWATVKLSAFFSLPAWCITQLTSWTISNQDYIAGVLACIAIDHIIGSFYHAFKVRDFTLKRNATGLLQKLGLCVLAIGLFEIIHNTVKDVALVYDYLKVITRLVVILYPAGSAFMNMSALTNGQFPPIGWIKKVQNFNENLDLDKLKKNEK
jgi:hypothetical protein